MPISKVKKQGWCDGEEDEGGKGEKRAFVFILTRDFGHFAHEHICYRASGSFLKQCQPD